MDENQHPHGKIDETKVKWVHTWQVLTFLLEMFHNIFLLPGNNVCYDTLCLPIIDGSLRVLRLLPPLKLVTMIQLRYCWKWCQTPKIKSNKSIVLLTDKLYHLRLRVECTLSCNLQNRARTHAVLVIGLYESVARRVTTVEQELLTSVIDMFIYRRFLVFMPELVLLPGICSKRLKFFSRYQIGNQKPYIEEGETTQWPKGKRTTYKYDLHNTTQKTKFILLSNLNPGINTRNLR
jgi:hypothetical protein